MATPYPFARADDIRTFPVLPPDEGRSLRETAALVAATEPARTAEDVEEIVTLIEDLTAAYSRAVDDLLTDAHRTLNKLSGERSTSWMSLDGRVTDLVQGALGEADPAISDTGETLRSRLSLLYAQAARRSDAA